MKSMRGMVSLLDFSGNGIIFERVAEFNRKGRCVDDVEIDSAGCGSGSVGQYAALPDQSAVFARRGDGIALCDLDGKCAGLFSGGIAVRPVCDEICEIRELRAGADGGISGSVHNVFDVCAGECDAACRRSDMEGIVEHCVAESGGIGSDQCGIGSGPADLSINRGIGS